MKICYFTYDYSEGAGVHARGFASALMGEGVDLSLISLGNWNSPAYTPYKPVAKSIWRRFAAFFGYDMKCLLKNVPYGLIAWKTVRRERPDLLIVRTSRLQFSTNLVARWHRLPIILEVNTLVSQEHEAMCKRHWHFNRLARLLEAAVLKSAAAITVVSEELRRMIAKQFGTPLEKMCVNHNGVDPEQFVPSVSSEAVKELKGWVRDRRVAGFIGSFQPWHGMPELIDAFAEIGRLRKDICLVIIGDGPLKRWVTHEVYERHLEDVVHILPPISHRDMPSYVQLFDIAVMAASNSYGSPVKIFEYMAMGKAILAPNSPAVKEILVHQRTAWLTDGGTHEIKEGLLKLLDDPALREALGTAARGEVLKNYTWRHNALRVMDVCKALLPDRDNHLLAPFETSVVSR